METTETTSHNRTTASKFNAESKTTVIHSQLNKHLSRSIRVRISKRNITPGLLSRDIWVTRTLEGEDHQTHDPKSQGLDVCGKYRKCRRL